MSVAVRISEPLAKKARNSSKAFNRSLAGQKTLLAYQWDAEQRILVTLGVHENFYRNLKKYACGK